MKSWRTSQMKIGQKDEQTPVRRRPRTMRFAKKLDARENAMPAEDSGDVEDDGVLGEQAQSDSRADCQPPAGIFSALSRRIVKYAIKHPPQESERSVLKFGAFEDGAEARVQQPVLL